MTRCCRAAPEERGRDLSRRLTADLHRSASTTRPGTGGCQQRQHFRADQRHVTSSDRHDQVARRRSGHQVGGHRRPRRLVGDLGVGQRHSIGDQSTGDAGYGVLAGRVDVHHDDLVGQGERPAELAGEGLGTAVEVRLEGDDQPPLAGHLAGGPQRGGELGRVVGVVVVDPHARRDALELEPATGTTEAGQSGGELVEGQAEPQADGERRGGVAHVVLARDLQPQPTHPSAAVDDLGLRQVPVEPQLLDAQVGVVGGAVRDDLDTLGRGSGSQPAGAGVVGAGDQEALRVKGFGKSDEGSLDRCLVGVVVEVVRLDVGDDGGERRQQQERAVALVGLGDEAARRCRCGRRSRAR